MLLLILQRKKKTLTQNVLMHVARRLLTTPALTFSEPEILEENDNTIICNLEIKARLIYFFFREQVVTCKVNLLVRVKIIVTATVYSGSKAYKFDHYSLSASTLNASGSFFPAVCR